MCCFCLITPCTPSNIDAAHFPDPAPPLQVLLFYLAATIYYLYVRIRFTLVFAYMWYSILILVVECIGGSPGPTSL